ncbi:outer membrane protein transport protein [bacterium]|nr:outer membrane protein transport protein [bacterium]
MSPLRNILIEIATLVLIISIWVIPCCNAGLSSSLAHNWSFYGDIELTGYSSFNEPMKRGELSDNSGLVGRLKFGVTYEYRDLFSTNICIVSEGASRYGLVLDKDNPAYYGTVEKVDESDLIPVIDTAEFEFRTPRENLWVRAGIIRPHRFSKYALPGILAGGCFRNVCLEVWYMDAGKRDR